MVRRNIITAKQSLEAAVTFYVRGFKLISDAIQNKLEGYSFQDAESSPTRIGLLTPPEGYYWKGVRDGKPYLELVPGIHESIFERDALDEFVERHQQYRY